MSQSTTQGDYRKAVRLNIARGIIRLVAIDEHIGCRFIAGHGDSATSQEPSRRWRECSAKLPIVKVGVDFLEIMTLA